MARRRAQARRARARRAQARRARVGQPLYSLADEPHGTLSIAYSFGTLADGGAFESVFVMIQAYGPHGMSGSELFELEHLEAAKTRFAELRLADSSQGESSR